MTNPIARISRPQSWRHEFIREHGYRCHYCNRPGGLEIGPDDRPWHIDHKNPLAEGGEDVEDNLALACKRCNLAKHTQPYKQFRRFALGAFWNDVMESASDEDLDSLLRSYAGTPEGMWFFEVGDGDGSPIRVISRPESENNNTADGIVAEIPSTVGRRNGDWAVADFLVRAHRLAPLMIAEIRLLRVELAEARGETQATEDAA